MSQLKDPRKVQQIKLPSFPNDSVELYDGLLTYEINELTDIEKDYDKGIETLRRLIKSWKFTNEKDEALEINAKSLGMLPTKDFTMLMNAVNKVFEDMDIKKKKN